MRLSLTIILLTLAACAAPGDAPRTAGPTGDATGPAQLHWVPVGDTGSLIQMRLCLPSGGVGPLVVINHGSPANAGQRPSMQPASCDAEAVSWFTDRGFTAALPMRRGYGPSGGTWAEGFGNCGQADFAAAGLETARDIQAAIDYAKRLPTVLGAAPAVIVGQSAGGWGSLALASRNPPGVRAVINMAGGRGGWSNGAANTNCQPDALARSAGAYGRTARIPVLSIYTANDSFFGPVIARDVQTQYTAAGGVMTARNLPAFGNDGHGLFFARGGSAIWGPEVERFLGARRDRPLASGAARGT